MIRIGVQPNSSTSSREWKKYEFGLLLVELRQPQQNTQLSKSHQISMWVFINGSHEPIEVQIVVHPWGKIDWMLSVLGSLIGWHTLTPWPAASSLIVGSCAAIYSPSLSILSGSDSSRRKVEDSMRDVEHFPCCCSLVNYFIWLTCPLKWQRVVSISGFLGIKSSDLMVLLMPSIQNKLVD